MRLIDAEEFEARLRMQPNELSRQTVIDMVHATPTKKGNEKWIPVSERLPLKEGRYLVTTSVWSVLDGAKLCPTPYVKLEVFENGRWFDGNRWSDDADEDVTAWLQMEMPEPYREGE